MKLLLFFSLVKNFAFTTGHGLEGMTCISAEPVDPFNRGLWVSGYIH